MFIKLGEPLWLSGKVVQIEKINEIERSRVRSPPGQPLFKKMFIKLPKVNCPIGEKSPNLVTLTGN
jgi:hypothetical protein